MMRWCVRVVHDRSLAQDETVAWSFVPLLYSAPVPAPRAYDLGRSPPHKTIALQPISPPTLPPSGKPPGAPSVRAPRGRCAPNRPVAPVLR